MDSTQRQEHPKAETTEGMLVTLSYKEAWTKAWSGASNGLRKQFLDLPNFDAKIFEEITGIDVEKADQIKVVADSKTVYISKDSAIALNLIKE